MGDPLESSPLDITSVLVESFWLCTQSLVEQANNKFREFIENIHLTEYVDLLSDKLVEYPHLRYVVFATALSCSIPVVMFIVFGVVSLFITFAGFLFIEGTLLAVGGLCMFVCIGTLILVLSILAMTLGILYMITNKLGHFLNRFDTPSDILRTIAPSISEGNTLERSAVSSDQN